MTSYGYDVMNCFAKFEKFLPHSIIIPSFMTIGSQMPELDRGGGGAFLPPPYKIGSQNTPYRLGLTKFKPSGSFMTYSRTWLYQTRDLTNLAIWNGFSFPSDLICLNKKLDIANPR